MTQAFEAAKGLVTPPPLHRLMEAVLLLWVSLVQGVATTLGMILNRNHRDWHATDAREELPQAKSDIHIKEANHTHGVILGLVPRISVGSPRGLAIDPLESHNQDSRHKAEIDTVDVETTRSLSFRAKARSAADPEPRGHTLRRRHVRLLASGSRLRASGMTPLVCQQR